MILTFQVTWDLNNPKNWTPFLPPAYGNVECWYSAPSLLNEGSADWNDATLSRRLLRSIAPAIQAYRRTHFKVAETLWHREASLRLQVRIYFYFYFYFILFFLQEFAFLFLYP